MLLLLDIGNTHTHLGLADETRVTKQANIQTRAWFTRTAAAEIRAFLGKAEVSGVAVCSVVPKATPICRRVFSTLPMLELTSKTACIGIHYPRPETIGPDRLANAIAVKAQFGAPAVVVDFGTAVTFDVVDRRGRYVGGIIAPGLSAMTDYLHEKTALLPRIKIREVRAVVGKNTEQAMLIGAVPGYRGLVRELIQELKGELKSKKLPVVATGGYAGLIAAKLPEITVVNPNLTLDGLRISWAHKGSRQH